MCGYSVLDDGRKMKRTPMTQLFDFIHTGKGCAQVKYA